MIDIIMNYKTKYNGNELNCYNVEITPDNKKIVDTLVEAFYNIN